MPTADVLLYSSRSATAEPPALSFHQAAPPFPLTISLPFLCRLLDRKSPGDGSLRTSSPARRGCPSGSTRALPVLPALQGISPGVSKLQEAKSYPRLQDPEIPRYKSFPSWISSHQPQSGGLCFIFQRQQEPQLDPLRTALLMPRGGGSSGYSPSLSSGADSNHCHTGRKAAFDPRSSSSPGSIFLTGKAAATTSALSQCHPPAAPPYQEPTFY